MNTSYMNIYVLVVYTRPRARMSLPSGGGGGGGGEEEAVGGDELLG